MVNSSTSKARAQIALVAVAALVAALLAALTIKVPPAGAAASGGITLSVQSARDFKRSDGTTSPHRGDAITKYKWMINEDDTGNPGTSANPLTNKCLPSRAASTTSTGAAPDETTYADSCPWPSTRQTAGWAKIVAQGDQTDLERAQALTDLPDGKYLISVTADDYKIDGAHFTVTATPSA